MMKILLPARGILLTLVLFLGLSVALAQAQGSRTISGTIRDEASGDPLPGVNILEKGTSNGAITDSNGQYSINVRSESTTLVFSFIGFATQEITVGSRSVIDVTLTADVRALEEVVVVGYGEQRKSIVTGAISRVSGENLTNIPNGRIETALQGRVAGVTISQNSGQPGSSSTIRIRGIATFGDAGNNPLWVVDGIVVDAGAIGYLNQQDIESIEVLKDATSAAIYGTRAATGVIIVTTKKGKLGNKFTIDYNGFVGTSAPARTLSLLNARQYATIMNEKSVGGGGAPIYADPSALGKGTDWQKQIFNKSAARSNHQISLSGGTEKSTFYMSLGYRNTEGIVATKISGFEQYNVRLNSTHKLSNVFTISQTLAYAHSKSKGIGNVNSEYGGPLSSALNLDPITPVIETDPAKLSNPSLYPALSVRNGAGDVYGISTAGVQEMSNPLAYVQTRLGRYNWDDNIIGNLALEANITEHLKFRSVASGKMAIWGNYGFTPAHYLGSGGGLSVPINNLSREINNRKNWNVENYLTYTRTIEDHSFSVLLGQGSYAENIGGGSNFTLYNLPVTSYKDASFGFYSPSSDYVASTYTTDGNLNNNIHKLISLFGRINYSYQDKYIFTGIIRRDGSNRFGANNRYGVFPGASVGWNVSKENFWPENDYISYLKIRGGFGVTGNDAIRDYGYLSLVQTGYNYTQGNTIIPGYAPSSLDNPNLKWEQTTQINVGLETTLLSDLDLTFDYYNKKTTGILRPITIPGYVGVNDAPVGNVADMQNSGIELELKYHRDLGPVRFSGSASFATLKNKVTYVATDVNYIAGDASFQNMGTVTRTQVGHSYNEFYGYVTDGIFQTQEEIDAYVNKDGDPIQPNAKPGDFKWKDLDGNGVISDDDGDRTFLGTSLPKYTFGFTLNFQYKNFDLMVFATGAGGNKIFQGLRRLDIGRANYTTAVLGRWTGEGTSNSYPRLSSDDPNRNFGRMSNFYLEKGDFMRLKVVQLGYTLPQLAVMNKVGIHKLRVYMTAENLLTFTKYTGYDPEIGGGVLGIDKGQYPQARSFLAGVQIQF